MHRACESKDQILKKIRSLHSSEAPLVARGRFATRFVRIDSRESFANGTPNFIARQADSHESLEFPIRANHPIRANRANRFARIMPLSESELLSTPNMTGRRFHRTMEMIPARPW